MIRLAALASLLAFGAAAQPAGPDPEAVAADLSWEAMSSRPAQRAAFQIVDGRVHATVGTDLVVFRPGAVDVSHDRRAVAVACRDGSACVTVASVMTLDVASAEVFISETSGHAARFAARLDAALAILSDGPPPTAGDEPAATLVLDDGARYEGAVRDGRPHGLGTATFANGNRYVGDWADGQMHGRGTFTYADGGTYVGPFVEGRLEGRGRMAFADGSVYDGGYRDWRWHGEGSMTHSNGDRYVGTFVDGVMSGRGTYAWPNGDVYEGEFAANAPHGRGRKEYADGTVCEGAFERWNRHGRVRCAFADGDVFEGTYRADVAQAGSYAANGQAPRPARWTETGWVWPGPPREDATSEDWSWETMIATDLLPAALQASATGFADLRGERLGVRGADTLWASVYQPDGPGGQPVPLVVRIEYAQASGTTKLYLSGAPEAVGLMMTLHDLSKAGVDRFFGSAGLGWTRSATVDPDRGLDSLQYSECGGEPGGRVAGAVLQATDPGFARLEIQVVRFDQRACSDG